jgi:hypothetical protein
MDAEEMQTVAARDQLWASLRALQPEIERLAAGEMAGTPREAEIAVLLARIVSAELRYRAAEGK